MSIGVLERPGSTLLVVGDEGVGAQIRARRERLGMSARALAKESGVDRSRIAAVEAGEAARGATTGAILAALDRLEQEMSGPYDDLPPKGGGDEVTIRLRGNFGTDVTVQGPVDNLNELAEQAERLLARLSERDEKSEN